jgi:hypothetical protein
MPDGWSQERQPSINERNMAMTVSTVRQDDYVTFTVYSDGLPVGLINYSDGLSWGAWFHLYDSPDMWCGHHASKELAVKAVVDALKVNHG